jgi:hypothetical protein
MGFLVAGWHPTELKAVDPRLTNKLDRYRKSELAAATVIPKEL